MHPDRVFASDLADPEIGAYWHRLPVELTPERALASEETFYYSARCPTTGERLRLPRTEAAERLLLSLAPTFPKREKMYGLLLAIDATGELGYLKAFSGGLDGELVKPGWAPPIRIPNSNPKGRAAPSEESAEVRSIERLGRRLEELDRALQAHPYRAAAELWAADEERLRGLHRQRKKRRREQRESGAKELADLALESGHDSGERARFTKARRAALGPLEADYRALEQQRVQLKRERRVRSRELQLFFHSQLFEELASLLSFPLERLFPEGPPTGTGDCCAPKLLAAAARWGLRPVALAELWWGDKPPRELLTPGALQGAFCRACEGRCGPLLGALLRKAGLGPLRVIHRDARVVAVDKPGGLLSLPGRDPWNGDSVLARLTGAGDRLWPVHRLDLETSGILLFARDARTAALLGRQFATGSVRKTYLARLERPPSGGRRQGTIEAPIARLGANPPRYGVEASGKNATTEYRVLDDSGTLVEFRPRTGRSHQLRVHAAEVLGAPILGDRIYGSHPGEGPLCLQAVGLVIRTSQPGGKLRLAVAPAAWADPTNGH